MNGLTISQEDWNAVAAERDAPPPPPQDEIPAPPEEQVAQPEPAPETPSSEPEPEVKASSLDPEVEAKLKRLDELTAVMPQLVNELREAKGRIGALQSQWDKARQQLEQPTQKQVAAAAKDPEKWDALKKDFPEWGEAISEFVETRLGGLTQAASGPKPEDIEQLVAQRAEAATAAAVKQINEKLVTLKHPKWREEVKTPEFSEWFNRQDPETRALAGSEDPFDAISVLDRYHEAAKAKPAPTADGRQRRLEAAATTGKPGSSGVVTKRFEDMTLKEQWDYMARQRERESGS